jgi:hypothetical protein
MIIKPKTYNTKVVWNSVVKLLDKENFKWRLMCDKFEKNQSNRFQTKLSLHQTKLETDGQNGFPSSRCIFFM